MSTLYYRHLTQFFAFFLIAFALFFGVKAEAASLNVSPAVGTYSAGQIFIVNVNVASSDQPMNAVSGKLFFPKDTIEVVGISKASSIVSLWVQEPSFSNTAGNLSFEGVVFNPGYQGSSGKVISVTFRAKAAGGANVTFAESSVLANDGNGTNILTGTVNGRYTITPKVAAPVKTTAPAKPTTPIVADEEKINVPVITQYPELIYEGDIFKVQGNTYPNSVVRIFVSTGNAPVAEDYVKSDSIGNYALVLSQKLKPGSYTFALQVTTYEGKTSPKTDQISFVVAEQGAFLKIGSIEATFMSFLLLLLLIIMSIVAGLIFDHHHHVVLKRKMMLHIKHMRHAIHTSLEPMKARLEDNVHVLEDAKGKRALTVEESLMLDKQKKLHEDIDDFLVKKIAEIEKLIDEGK